MYLMTLFRTMAATTMEGMDLAMVGLPMDNNNTIIMIPINKAMEIMDKTAIAQYHRKITFILFQNDFFVIVLKRAIT